MGINRPGIQQFAGGIHSELASGTKSRIQSNHHMPFEWRLVEKRAGIVGKNMDGMQLCPGGKLPADITLDGREQ